MRFGARIAMLPVPGFSDHLPSDYEVKLRAELLSTQQPAAGPS